MPAKIWNVCKTWKTWIPGFTRMAEERPAGYFAGSTNGKFQVAEIPDRLQEAIPLAPWNFSDAP